MHPHTHTRAHPHTYIHTRAYAKMHAHTQPHTFARTHAQTHSHTHTRTNTHTRTHTHTHTTQRIGNASATARAKFHYAAQQGDELSLNPGDVIAVTGESADGWFWGYCNGRKGLLPANHVSFPLSLPPNSTNHTLGVFFRDVLHT